MTIGLYWKRSALGRFLVWMIAFYVAAKLLEYFDAPIFAASQWIGGHALKHVVAAMAPAALLYGLSHPPRERFPSP